MSGSKDKTVRVWDMEIGEIVGRAFEEVMEGHTKLVTSVAWSGDGKRVVSGSEDKTVRVWDVETGECLKVMEGHTGEVNSVAVSGDGRRGC